MFREYLNTNKEILLRQLKEASSLQEANESICSFLHTMQNECANQLHGDRRQEVCRIIVDVAISAISCIQSVSEVDVLFKNKTSRRKTNSPYKKTNWWYYIGVVASLGLMMHFILSSSFIAAVVCGALSFWQVIVFQHARIDSIVPAEQPEIVSSVKLNADDLLKWLSRCVTLMDEQLRRLFENVPNQTSNMQWTNEAMKVLQVLWCEEKNGDGIRLSDVVRELFEQLQNEGLIISDYTRDLDKYFDKMPGRNEGKTLSPVLMRENRVFVRGIMIQNH